MSGIWGEGRGGEKIGGEGRETSPLRKFLDLPLIAASRQLRTIPLIGQK